MLRHTKCRRVNVSRPVTWAAVLVAAVVILLAAAAHVTEADSSGTETEHRVYAPLATSLEMGESWERVGKAVALVEKFYSVDRCDVHTLAGSDLGVYSLKSPATDWQREQMSITSAPTDVAFVPGHCAQAYATILGHGVWRGNYTGQDWTWVRVDKDNQLSTARSVAIVPSGSNLHIYVAGDFGIKWLPQLPTAPQTWQATNRETLTTSLSTDGSVLASVWNDGVYVLVGNGFWSPLGAGSPPDKLIYEAAFDGSRGIAGTQSGAALWGGSAWQPVPAIQQTTFAVALDELGLFAGQRTTGVTISTDGGTTWLPFNESLEGVGGSEFQVRDLHVLPDPDNEKGHICLYAATTTGIWRWGTCP
ncbi:MAG: hypothetical protein IPH95_13975 [Candidatus Promineofilum sp.]|nr:hypothetical protein [Promineifilum sp.]